MKNIQNGDDLHQVPDELCNIKNKIKYPYASGRRVHDFSIMGANQACNHTCPTFCVDTYEPVCAIITTANSYQKRPMINHCHVDLLSCALGANVTLEPMTFCYMSASRLVFMMQAAALKKMGLIDSPPHNNEKRTSAQG
ncbi:unnamed protein product [Parnassius mnemosyne]|uniref:Uncharacterized protein n=1 Tax=Parnassius mnemosyne TaxID=213953 RepID=A0AAV1LXD4_9NEOP